MIKKIAKYINDEYSLPLKIYMAIFALISQKCIFVNPYSIFKGFAGIIIGIFTLLIIFAVIIISVYFLTKTSYEYKDNQTKVIRIFLYMIPGLIMSSILFLTYYPGIIPYDTAYMWQCVDAGMYSNSHPIIYNVYMKLLRGVRDNPDIFVVIQIIFTSLIYGYIGYVLEKNGLKHRYCFLAVTILGLAPVNAIHSVTILKDIPYIMSMILISAVMYDIILCEKIKKSHILLLFISGITAVSSRYNAALVIPMIFILAALLYLIKKNYKKVITLMVILAMIFAGNYALVYVSYNIINNEFFDLAGSSAAFTIPSYQMVYISSENYREFEDDIKEEINFFVDRGYVESLRSENEERWKYNFNYLGSMHEIHVSSYKVRFLKLYLKLIRMYPKTAIKAYENITSIVWAVPNQGYTVARNRRIAIKSDDVVEDSKLPKLQNLLENSSLYSGENLLFLWRPALWMLLSLLLLIIALKRHGVMSLMIFSPALFNAFGYMLANPAQNVRYLYCNFSILIIMTAFTFIKKVDLKKENH